MDARKKLKKAKVQLLLQNPFFASLILPLREEEADLPFTMGTDGTRLLYNPRRIRELDLEEVVGVLAHEASHIALLHPVRREHRRPELWNQACDYAVNPIVLNAGFVLPKGGLLDDRFRGKYAEEIYAELDRPAPGGGQNAPRTESPEAGRDDDASSGGGSGSKDAAPSGGGQDSPGGGSRQEGSGSRSPRGGDIPRDVDPTGMGAVLDPPPGTDLRELERDLRQRIARAAQAAKSEGRIPGGLEELIEEILYPRLPWREILRRFIDASIKSDYSYLKPNRRLLHRGLWLPGLSQPAVEELVVAVDTSASISREELEEFAAEVNAIAQLYDVRKLIVVYCDARIQGIREITPPEPVRLEARGRGGTDFRPVFELVRERINSGDGK